MNEDNYNMIDEEVSAHASANGYASVSSWKVADAEPFNDDELEEIENEEWTNQTTIDGLLATIKKLKADLGERPE